MNDDVLLGGLDRAQIGIQCDTDGEQSRLKMSLCMHLASTVASEFISKKSNSVSMHGIRIVQYSKCLCLFHVQPRRRRHISSIHFSIRYLH